MNKKRTAKATLVAFGLSLIMPCAAMAASDIDGHWAQSVLEKWEAKGLIGGYEDGTVRPDAELSRAEMVAFINRAAGLTEGTTISFKDVVPTDWYAAEVAAAVKAGYIGGFEDNTFRGSKTVTRAELASMIARVNNLEEDAAYAEKFADANELPGWAKGAIGAVAEAGYMVGNDNKFNGNAVVTRAEAIASLDRAYPNAGEVEKDVDKEEEKKPVSGGGGYTPRPTPPTTETVPTPEANITAPTLSPEEKAAVEITTTVDKTAAAGEVDATTELDLPAGVAVSTVTLPNSTEVVVNGVTVTLDAPLTESMPATGGSVEFTVAEIEAVINEAALSAEDQAKLAALSDDRVLITATNNNGAIEWKIDGMTSDEIAAVFAKLQVTLTK